ncbi:hypothetical protein X943_000190 [Babesia divergens]|uniref:Uncharacterized protein n=1 Tax=Babesia divergens TaxID=32595 RepID=A0AAD9LGQ1_BABDI|nr:hypothetical protein X943_000190 [Babesia divergens]
MKFSNVVNTVVSTIVVSGLHGPTADCDSSIRRRIYPIEEDSIDLPLTFTVDLPEQAYDFKKSPKIPSEGFGSDVQYMIAEFYREHKKSFYVLLAAIILTLSVGIGCIIGGVGVSVVTHGLAFTAGAILGFFFFKYRSMSRRLS